MIAIAAMTRRRVIGASGSIPWHLPGDLKFFKRTTLGHRIIMGRKTYESIGRPLPGRENIVLSRQPGAPIPGVVTVRSPEEISPTSPGTNSYVIGGAEIYRTLLPLCTEILLTRVYVDPDGDTFFPEFESQFSTPTLVESTEDYEILLYSRLPNDQPRQIPVSLARTL